MANPEALQKEAIGLRKQAETKDKAAQALVQRAVKEVGRRVIVQAEKQRRMAVSRRRQAMIRSSL
jgi:hypothetical protein